MTPGQRAPLRADAARNAERILRTARAVFADLGPDAPLEEIARRADVRIRTLFNHFPSKADLVRAALDQAIAEDLAPGTNGWRRYLALIFEGLTPTAAKPLPAPVAPLKDSRTGNWSL